MIQMRLSSREIEVLDKISLGLTTHEIAEKLFLSKHTIESHRKNLLLKMSARNTACMVRKAFESGVLQLREYHYS